MNADTITNANKAALSFDLTYNKTNRTYNYAFTSTGGGTPVTGSGTTTGATQTVSGINITSLPDGKITLSVTITDSFSATGPAVTDTAPKAILDSALVGHWTFDSFDVSGTTAFDRSGAGLNGTLNNGTLIAAGQIGNAASFDGINDTVSVADNNIYDITDNITISLWYRPAATPSGFAAHPIAKWAGGISIDNFSLYHFGPPGTPNSTGYYAGRGGAWGTTSGQFIITLNTWTHIVWIYNSVTGGRLYVNGVASGGFTGSGLLGTNAQPIIMGSGFTPIVSRLDDVRIYNRVLTPTEITTLYNASL